MYFCPQAKYEYVCLPPVFTAKSNMRKSIAGYLSSVLFLQTMRIIIHFSSFLFLFFAFFQSINKSGALQCVCLWGGADCTHTTRNMSTVVTQINFSTLLRYYRYILVRILKKLLFSHGQPCNLQGGKAFYQQQMCRMPAISPMYCTYSLLCCTVLYIHCC